MGLAAIARAWLVYDTTKIVRIYDKRLALLYYGSVITIILFTFYGLVYNKGYLEEEDPVGAVNIHLQPNSTIRQPISSLPYCKLHQCVYWDESEIVFPLGTKEVLITTRVVSEKQKIICEDSETFGKICSWVQVPGSSKEYFVAGVESSILVIDHSAQAPVFHDQWLNSRRRDTDDDDIPNYAGTCKQMNGVLMNSRGSAKKIAKDLPKGELDQFKISELLAASRSDLNGTSISGFDYRSNGIVLNLDLGYNNARCSGKISCAFGTVPLHYRYRVYNVAGAEYFHESFHLYDTHRERIMRYGILVKVIQTGKISRVSWGVFLVNFSSGLGLFALAVMIVDIVAIYLLPERASYSHRKYSEVSKSGDKIKQH